MSYVNGTKANRVSQRFLLEAVQRGESFVYAILTREGAIKIGVTSNLANRKGGIKFGGTEQILAYRPGTLQDEQAIHASLTEHRIYGTREYYYPYPEMLPTINAMRDWMGIRPLRRRDLPRLANCTFHHRVIKAQSLGTSAFA